MNLHSLLFRAKIWSLGIWKYCHCIWQGRRSQDLKINNKSIPKGNVNRICVAVLQKKKVSSQDCLQQFTTLLFHWSWFYNRYFVSYKIPNKGTKIFWGWLRQIDRMSIKREKIIKFQGDVNGHYLNWVKKFGVKT